MRVLDALPARPLLAGERGPRLSLAGAQSKVPVVLVDDAVALALPGQPTTHILKPPIPRFPATTENEAFAMRLAAAVARALTRPGIDSDVLMGLAEMVAGRAQRCARSARRRNR